MSASSCGVSITKCVSSLFRTCYTGSSLPPSTRSTPSRHSPPPVCTPVLQRSFSPEFDPSSTPVRQLRSPVLQRLESPEFDPPSTPVRQLRSPVLQRSDSPEFEPEEQTGKRQLRPRKTVTAEAKKLVVRMPTEKAPRRAAHAPPAPAPAPESVYPSHKPGAYMCPHPGCNKVFKFAYDVAKHEKCHDPDEEYICHIEGCDYVTNKYKLFMDHKKMCGQEPFKCRYCKARFRSRQQRIRHEAKH